MKYRIIYFITWLVLSICYGVFIVKAGLQEMASHYLVVLPACALLTGILTNIIYNYCYSRKINELLVLFNEEKYIDYIAEMEPIRSRVKSKHLRDMCVVNIGTAYSCMGEFEQALNLYLSITEKRLISYTKGIYHMNRLLCYFRLNRGDEGLAYYENVKKSVDELRAFPDYQPHVEVLYLYMMLEKGEFTEAREQLEFVCETFPVEVVGDDCEYIEECILYKEGMVSK